MRNFEPPPDVAGLGPKRREAVGAVGFAGPVRNMVIAHWLVWPTPDRELFWNQQMDDFHLLKAATSFQWRIASCDLPNSGVF